MSDKDQGRSGGPEFPCAALDEALPHLRRPPTPAAIRERDPPRSGASLNWRALRPKTTNRTEGRATMASMAVPAKKLDVKVGDLVEIEGRRYEVVPDKAGGVALEAPVTKTVAQLRAERGARALTAEEFEELFGDLPSDGEG